MTNVFSDDDWKRVQYAFLTPIIGEYQHIRASASEKNQFLAHWDTLMRMMKSGGLPVTLGDSYDVRW